MPSATGMTVSRMEHGTDKKLNFGAYVTGLDLNDATDDEVDALRDAILQHKVVIVKNQHNQKPGKNWELLKRLDPQHVDIKAEDYRPLFDPTGDGFFAVLDLKTVPDAGAIHLMGKGYHGKDHFGLKDVNLEEKFGGSYYSKPLAEEDFKAGIGRFQSWHFDGSLYKLDPATFSSLRYIQLPTGEQTVDWADGSGLSMKIKPGCTAFFSSSELYEILTPEEQKMLDHSSVEYMHWPYEWIRGCRGNSNGLGVASEGRELPMDVMEAIPHDPADTKTYPMVWVNPLTGEKSLQVQPNCVRRIHMRHGPDEDPTVIDNVEEIRALIQGLQSRIIRPEYIYVGPEEEGDHVLWYNRGMMHARIDYPIEFGTRIVHQGWIPSQEPPVGAQPVRVA